MTRLSNRWLAALGAALLLAGCAQNTGDINRIQPNVAKKSDLLEGQWYFRNTVTWTPASTGFTYTGETGKLEKIVWEIQEKSLVGYRAYPFIPGQEAKIDESSKISGTTAKVCGLDGKCVGGKPYYGAPLVAYPILKQFDKSRNYNAATGETGNVLEENASDRPWNQRDFIRVDWSASLLAKEDSMGWNMLQNPSGATDFNAWIQKDEPGTDPYDWPNFEYDNSSGKLSYMDFTSRFMAWPDVVYTEQGAYPRCYFTSGARYDCTSQEIRMRTSISKIDADKTNDYQPLVYGNDLMTKFGFFRTERYNYDRKFGTTETARINLANRYRIFESSFEKDVAGHPDLSKPIALDQRKLKPIVYYVSPAARTSGAETYKEYLETARILERDWDVAFRRAAGAAQGKDPGQVPQMLYVCENPVPATDTLTGAAPAAACGKTGFEAKMGDLRYSFLYTVTEPVPNGLLGYGPSSADPETGEIISANANTYTGAVDTSAQHALDVIDTLVGDKTVDQLISGQDVVDYIRANPAYSTTRVHKSGLIQSELQGIPQTEERSMGAFERPAQRSLEVLQSLRTAGGLPAYSSDRMKVAAELLKQNPVLESSVLDNPDFQKDLVGLVDPQDSAQAEADPAFARTASRKALTSFSDSVSAQKDRLEWASRKNLYLAEFIDTPMTGLALKENARRQVRIAALVAQGDSRCANAQGCTTAEARKIADNELRRRLQQAIWLATAEHEIGHTFGLRHNFQGSFDAINYFDEYWKLRQPTLTVVQNGQAKVPRTPTDLKNASDGTEEQVGAGIHDYEYSSIMDYGGKINADWKGIGKYDEAAILFAYSGGNEPGYVEVFDAARSQDLSFPINGSDGKVLAAKDVTAAAYDLPIVNASHINQGIPNYSERFHYSVVPLHFGIGSDLETTFADGINKLRKRHLAKWSDVQKQTQRLTDLLKINPHPGIDDVGVMPLEVPYMFCTDDHVGAVLSCARFDRGPDYYEIAKTKIEDYWNVYYFTHFKRDRYAFSSSGAMNNAYGTFDDLGNIYKHWVHAFYRTGDPSQQNLSLVTPDPLIQDTWSMAVLDSANAHLNVMSVPAAGFYMFRNFGNGRAQWDVISEGDEFDQLNSSGQQILKNYYSNANYFNPPASRFTTILRGEARRMYSRYDYKSGFNFWTRMIEAGHYNDQAGAMFAAVSPSASFLGTDEVADHNRYAIPYYLVFKKEFGDTFGGLWSENEKLVRPTMYLSKDDTGAVTTKAALAFKTYVEGKNYISNFDYPKRLDLACGGGTNTNCLEPSQYAAPVNIQVTWTSRIYSLWLGMAMFNVNYDLDYAKSNQVFKLGGKEQVQLAANYHPVEVVDMTTGARYVAPEANGAAPDSTPAITVVNRAKEYAQVVANPTLCPMPEHMAALGYSCMAADEMLNPTLVEQRRKDFTEAFKNVIRDLDLMRGFYGTFGKAF